jgi:starch synthase
VTTNVGALPELVDDGVTGLLVPPREPAALAEALIGLLSDPPRAERMGRAGQQKVAERLTWRAVAERMAPHLEAAVARG